jgi:dihydroneopterin aldolase
MSLLKMNELQHLNTIINTSSKAIVTQVTTLIDVFAEAITDPCIKEMRRVWILARSVISCDDIADQCGKYFLYFKKYVMEDDFEYMVNYDFSTLVIPGTIKSTKDLIEKLTTSIIAVWKKGDEVVNARIVKISKQLIRLATVNEEAKKKAGLVAI